MKEPFALQVAVVVLLLLAGIVCIPLPGGGMLFHRLTGRATESPSTPVPSVPTTIAAVPIAVVPVSPPPAHVSSTRFQEELAFTEDTASSTEAWTRGMVGGRTSWRDNKSGMIWGPRLDMTLTDFSDTALKAAQERCRTEEPQGSWALPTAAEFDIAKVNGLLKTDDGARHRWISYIDVNGLILPAGRGYIPVAEEKEFSVRCVGRSPAAPAEGYSQTTNEITLKAMAE